MVIYGVVLNKNVQKKLNNLCNILSAEEVHYGFAIKHSEVKTSYFASKLLTRLFLSKNLAFKVIPNEWSFSKGRYGKPKLSSEFNYLSLYFNVSQCDGLYAIAFDEKPLGLDVESYRFKIDDNLANTVFNDVEIVKTIGMTADEKDKYYLKLWTIKESFAKQSGMGINTPFQKLSAEEISEDFFKVNFDTKTKSDLLTKNVSLKIENEEYSLSVSAGAEQFPTYSLEIITDKNWCFEDAYPFLLSDLKYIL